MSENHPKAPQSVFTYAGHGLIRLATTGKYYARFKHHGKQIKKRLNTANKPRALRLLADLRAEASNVTSREAGRVTFANIGKRWIENRRGTVKAGTLKRDQDCIDNLEPYFRTVTLSGVTPENCESWKAKRGDAMAPQTFNRELGTLHAVFEFAVEQGIIWKNPARGIKRRRATATRSKQIPTDAQFAQILAAIRQGDGRKGIAAQDGADFVELLAYSGMRRSEAAALQWREVDFAKGLLTVSGGTQGTKNSETRTVPIGAQLRRLLERMHRQQQPEPTATVARIADPKKCLATAARKLGLPYFSPHRFRDFFATISLEKKTAPHLVASWLGHKDGGALLLKTYAHVRQEESKAAMDKITFGIQEAIESGPAEPLTRAKFDAAVQRGIARANSGQQIKTRLRST